MEAKAKVAFFSNLLRGILPPFQALALNGNALAHAGILSSVSTKRYIGDALPLHDPPQKGGFQNDDET